MPKTAAKKIKGLKQDAVVALPMWSFIQWMGDNEQEVVDFLAPSLAGVSGWRSLDGLTFLLLVRATGRDGLFQLAYATTGVWVAVNPTPTGTNDVIVVVPDASGSPSGFAAPAAG